MPISVLRRRWRNVLRAHQPKEITFTVDIGLDLCSFLDDNCPSLGISFLHQINSLAWGGGGGGGGVFSVMIRGDKILFCFFTIASYPCLLQLTKGQGKVLFLLLTLLLVSQGLALFLHTSLPHNSLICLGMLIGFHPDKF